MKYIELNHDLKVSQLVFGCMRISEMSVDDLESLVNVALDSGINFFDHADIYGGGKSEELFGEVLVRNPEMRKHMIIQSKCGIVKGKGSKYFDFSKEYILKSVDGILERLHTDYIDVLLLHRPDTLMDPKEVGEAFQELYDSGKVKYFGVSNMNPMQIELLQKYVDQKLLFNQLQLSPVHSGMITNGIFMNMKEEEGCDRDGGILDYCRLHDITIQAWSIMQASWAEGSFLGHVDYPELNDCLARLAKKYGVEKSAIVIAWFMRHPANIQAICGTTKEKHLLDLIAGCDIKLSRAEWYEIYTTAIKCQLP